MSMIMGLAWALLPTLRQRPTDARVLWTAGFFPESGVSRSTAVCRVEHNYHAIEGPGYLWKCCVCSKAYSLKTSSYIVSKPEIYERISTAYSITFSMIGEFDEVIIIAVIIYWITLQILLREYFFIAQYIATGRGVPQKCSCSRSPGTFN